MQYIFWVSVLLIMYIYIGYPAILYVFSRNKFKTVNKNYFKPSVTIIISAYNEEKNIQKKLNNIIEFDYPKDLLEVIIVSDGSNDKTVEIIRSNDFVKLIDLKERSGKATCINEAVSLACNEILILMDVRQQADPNAINELVYNFDDETVGAVSGELIYSLVKNNTRTSENAGFYWKYEKFIRKSESDIGSVQGVTGALYAIRKSMMSHIPNGTILDDVYVPMMVVKKGYRVLFESEAIIYDEPSLNEASERRRKIRTIAGNYQLLAMNHWLLSPVTNPCFFQYFSHKVLRLFSPFVLIVSFLSLIYLSIYNSSNLYSVLFVISVSVGLASFFCQFNIKIISKVLNVIHAFLQLNIYALLGAIEYINNKNIYLWK